MPSELEGSYNEEILEEEILTSGIEAPSEDVELQPGEAPTDSDENLIVNETPEESLLIEEELITSEAVPEADEAVFLSEPALEEIPASFEQVYYIGDAEITVKAEPGVFPADGQLSVELVPVYTQAQAKAAVEEVR